MSDPLKTVLSNRSVRNNKNVSCSKWRWLTPHVEKRPDEKKKCLFISLCVVLLLTYPQQIYAMDVTFVEWNKGISLKLKIIYVQSYNIWLLFRFSISVYLMSAS